MIRIYKDNFRKFWQLPRKAGIDLQDRQVTFLELFYDLVYVAIIAQLTHTLAYNMTGQGILEFAFLFTTVWWGWFNGTIYHDLHGNNDYRTRIFTFLQMMAVISMAIFAGDALDKGANGFALSYAAHKIILAILWWRTGAHDKNHRPLSRPYAVFFYVTAAMFAISPFVSLNNMYILWFSSLGLALLMPIYLYLASRKNEAVKSQVKLIIGVSPSLVERFGLFTIIVLGEIIIGIVNSAAKQTMTLELGIPIAITVLISIGLWRVYFDFISHRKPHKDIKSFAFWYYLHLPLTIGITIIGATSLHIIEYIHEPMPRAMQLIFSFGAAMFMLSSSALIPILSHRKKSMRYYNTASRTLVFSATIMIVLGCVNIDTTLLLFSVVILLSLPFVMAFRVWLLEIGAKQKGIADSE